MNGTTDYLEMQGYSDGTTIQVADFSAILSASGNGIVSGTGASALSGLADVALSSPASGQVLTFNGTSWVNVTPSATTAISGTTTMVNGWPDAILCNASAGNSRILFLSYSDSSTSLYRRIINNASDEYISFNSAGNYSGQSGASSYDCVTSTKSISTLYAEGRAFNFLGGNGSGSTALGDRLTSGTLAVTTNSATSIISLSTAGTTWGYLGSAASYLPNLATNNISLSTINGVSVSALGGGASPTNVPAFRAHRNGTAQTIPTNTQTKVLLTTEDYDTYNNFDTGTSRFTPTIAGYYLITGSTYCLSTAGYCYSNIYKNGVRISVAGTQAGGTDDAYPSTVLVYMNGSTDYAELYAFSTATTLGGSTIATYFTGTLVASGNGLISGSGAGVSAMSSLTDVTLTSPAANSILVYDGSKWVNKFVQDTVSTSTMVSGWPDALICTDTGGSPAPTGRKTVLTQGFAESTGRMSYQWSTDTAVVQVTFNTDGSYYSTYQGSSTDTFDCQNKSISTLYAEGKAFNFIGGTGNGSTALGDRLTSGTLAVTTNSATSIISLSTAGTTWGYLGSAASYIPNLATNNISLSTINGVSVSALGGGASPTNVPAFRATMSATQTGVSAGTWTKVSFATKDFDTYNSYNSSTSRFTPTVAGNYLFVNSVYCNQGTNCFAAVYKNGGMVTYEGASGVTDVKPIASSIVYMNGSTDYVEAYGYTSGNSFISFGASFSGSLLASGNGLISGTTATDRIVSGTTAVIANTAGSVAINAPVQVSGSVNFANNPGEACNSGNYGSVKQVNGRLVVCRQ
ncbi:MAG: hypothetical protein DI628_08900 [Blastochloris viridis]|uniref:C1q domain-containing protein n=1 Tax=Blastochloris viridis TaxID=1079 RepID=A0A6N4R970_BLAVI|nr:MAG: hypothetical protein DI628_08900 [Blastochloris viridis]